MFAGFRSDSISRRSIASCAPAKSFRSSAWTSASISIPVKSPGKRSNCLRISATASDAVEQAGQWSAKEVRDIAAPGNAQDDSADGAGNPNDECGAIAASLLIIRNGDPAG